MDDPLGCPYNGAFRRGEPNVVARVFQQNPEGGTLRIRR